MKVLQILVLIFGLIVLANGQNAEKIFVLSGTVFDSAKAVVPATEVIAENKDGRNFQTTSDENGIYRLSIPYGEYTVIFNKDGFKKSIYTNVNNLLLPERKLEVNLEVGSCSDCNGEMILDDEVETKNKTNKIYLRGIITDQVGAVIQKAKIEIRGNKQKLTVATDENGLYEISLPEGIYTIEFEAPGHKSYKIKDYRIKSNQSMSLDIALFAIPTPII